MRALIITLVLAAILGAGGFFYWRADPAAFEPAPAPQTEPEPPPAPRAEHCSAQNALYAHRRDPSLTLRLIDGPDRIMAYGSSVQDYGNLGDLFFIVSKEGRDYRYVAASSVGYTLNYLFPLSSTDTANIPRGVDLIQVGTFDTQMQYTAGLPRLEYAAPAHIYAPNLLRHLFTASERQIQTPIDFFDFQSCSEDAPAPSTLEPASEGQ